MIRLTHFFIQTLLIFLLLLGLFSDCIKHIPGPGCVGAKSERCFQKHQFNIATEFFDFSFHLFYITLSGAGLSL